MRKYYSKKSPAIADLSIQDGANAPWMLLSAFVQGSVDILENDIYMRCMDIISRKSVKDYLNLCSDLDQLSQRYESDCDPELVFCHRQIIALLKKYPFTEDESGLDPRAAAIAKWRDAEDKCALTNQRLKEISSPEDLPKWVSQARILIDTVLEELKPELIMEIISSGSHGPGSTLSSNGNRVTEYYKYSDLPYSVTENAAPYAFAAISANPRWMQILEDSGRRSELPPLTAPLFQKELMLLRDCVEIVDSDKIAFVPKDARTDRPIAVGASLNMYLQLGVKAYMEKRLKRVGVDLRDQSKNQNLAYQG